MKNRREGPSKTLLFTADKGQVAQKVDRITKASTTYTRSGKEHAFQEN